MAALHVKLSPTEAVYVIDRLVRERRVPASLVEKLRSERETEIRQLEERLTMLRGSAAAKQRGTRRAPNLSPETRASRRLQGQYLNLIRRIPEQQRGRYKKIAQTEGREAAIKALRKTL